MPVTSAFFPDKFSIEVHYIGARVVNYGDRSRYLTGYRIPTTSLKSDRVYDFGRGNAAGAGAKMRALF
ncbi:MAG TPA: hypothetical protein V6D28_08365 [Leptolyngbyaceae cyanobacterium]